MPIPFEFFSFIGSLPLEPLNLPKWHPKKNYE